MVDHKKIMPYDDWFAQELSLLIQAVAAQDLTSVQRHLTQVDKGIAYAEATPGQISSILLALGRRVKQVIESMLTERPRTGLPIPRSELESAIQQQAVTLEKTPRHEQRGLITQEGPREIDIDELKHVVKERKKKKTLDELRGGLDDLLDEDI